MPVQGFVPEDIWEGLTDWARGLGELARARKTESSKRYNSDRLERAMAKRHTRKALRKQTRMSQRRR